MEWTGERSPPPRSGAVTPKVSWETDWPEVAHSTGPCAREISCETRFKPPNHKNGRFSSSAYISQISQGSLHYFHPKKRSGQPPTLGVGVGGRRGVLENSKGGELWVPFLAGTLFIWASLQIVGPGERARPAGPSGEIWSAEQKDLEAGRAASQ